MKGAKKYGIPFAAYHFSYFLTEEQARKESMDDNDSDDQIIDELFDQITLENNEEKKTEEKINKDEAKPTEEKNNKDEGKSNEEKN